MTQIDHAAINAARQRNSIRVDPKKAAARKAEADKIINAAKAKVAKAAKKVKAKKSGKK